MTKKILRVVSAFLRSSDAKVVNSASQSLRRSFEIFRCECRELCISKP